MPIECLEERGQVRLILPPDSNGIGIHGLANLHEAGRSHHAAVQMEGKAGRVPCEPEKIDQPARLAFQVGDQLFVIQVEPLERPRRLSSGRRAADNRRSTARRGSSRCSRVSSEGSFASTRRRRRASLGGRGSLCAAGQRHAINPRNWMFSGFLSTTRADAARRERPSGGRGTLWQPPVRPHDRAPSRRRSHPANGCPTSWGSELKIRRTSKSSPAPWTARM